MFFGGDVFRAASGQGFSRSGLLVLSVLSCFSAFGYSVGRCDGLPVVGAPAVVLVFFPVPGFPSIIFYFLACILSMRFRYPGVPLLAFVRRRLLLLAVMVLFYPSEYKKAVAICQRLKV